ncbi:hypothetical protein [Rhizobium hainanense]|nr:hypothetical protein [Rhizobium hainanense]
MRHEEQGIAARHPGDHHRPMFSYTSNTGPPITMGRLQVDDN